MKTSSGNIIISFQILLILTISLCILTFYDIAYAQVNSNSLESIAKQTGMSDDIPQIKVGNYPSSLYLSSNAPEALYVANSNSDTVSVIDITTNTVRRTIPVDDNPVCMYGDRQSAIYEPIYVVNSDSDTVSVIDTTIDTVIETITVGDSPSCVYGDLPYADVIYVTNFGSNTVSVINTTTNTVIETITGLAGPTDIYVDGFKDVIYVANFASETVSVIEASTNTVIRTIPVGESPDDIYHDHVVDAIYVANSYSNTLSVIDGSTDTVIKNITVGDGPFSVDASGNNIYVTTNAGIVSVIDKYTNTVIKNITVGDGSHYPHISSEGILYLPDFTSGSVSIINTTTNTMVKNITVGSGPLDIIGEYPLDAVYVANSGSNTISVINAMTNEVVAGVTFDVSPFRTGAIVCNDIDTPINRYFYVSSGTKCIAEPIKGFEFSSWIEILDGNSTRTINTTTTSGSPWTGLLDIFNLKSDDPAATLTVNQFGNFTAYFRALPPAIPSEYWIPLYGVIVSTVVGWSIPSIISSRRSKRQTARLNSYHQKMTSLYDDGKLDEKDTEQLNRLIEDIITAYSEGKINNEQYTNLKNEISILYEEIYKKRIDSLKESSDGELNLVVLMDKIKEDILDAYSKGKITEIHYNLLNKRLEPFVNSSQNKTSGNKSEAAANQTRISKRSPI